MGFAALEEMLGGDRAAVQEVLESFRTATRENMAALERATEGFEARRSDFVLYKCFLIKILADDFWERERFHVG